MPSAKTEGAIAWSPAHASGKTGHAPFPQAPLCQGGRVSRERQGVCASAAAECGTARCHAAESGVAGHAGMLRRVKCRTGRARRGAADRRDACGPAERRIGEGGNGMRIGGPEGRCAGRGWPAAGEVAWEGHALSAWLAGRRASTQGG